MGEFSSEVHSPLIFKGVIKDWPSLKWTPQYLADILKDKKFRCKILERDNDKTLPETECLHMMCSLRQYCDWLNGNCDKDNPLSGLAADVYSIYVDYKHMQDMFVDQPELLDKVNWANFGFPDRNGAESSIWIGSAGAYTPCHQDTYGFNLVTQVYGSKRWILFPPSHSSFLYPTRIPYEESSIFCEVNILKPDLKRHKLFEKATPYIVDLHQGDALYVPRHWWHFVQCNQSSISINTWLPMEADQWSHVTEAVTKFLLTVIVSSLPDVDMDKTINPNEELVSPEKCLKYIEVAVKGVRENCRDKRDENNLKLEHSARNAIENPGCSNNMTKFIHQFKASEVKTLYNVHPPTVEQSIIHHLENSDLTVRKKMKLSENGCYTKSSGSSNPESVEIYQVRRWTLDEFMIMLDKKQADTSQTPESEQCSRSLECDSVRSHKEETLTESFTYKLMNAVLKSTSVDNISENILREMT